MFDRHVNSQPSKTYRHTVPRSRLAAALGKHLACRTGIEPLRAKFAAYHWHSNPTTRPPSGCGARSIGSAVTPQTGFTESPHAKIPLLLKRRVEERDHPVGKHRGGGLFDGTGQAVAGVVDQDELRWNPGGGQAPGQRRGLAGWDGCVVLAL